MRVSAAASIISEPSASVVYEFDYYQSTPYLWDFTLDRDGETITATGYQYQLVSPSEGACAPGTTSSDKGSTLTASTDGNDDVDLESSLKFWPDTYLFPNGHWNGTPPYSDARIYDDVDGRGPYYCHKIYITFTFSVTGTVASHGGTYSAFIKMYRDLQGLDAPSSLIATSGNQIVDLEWTAPTNPTGENITGYGIYRDTVNIANTTNLFYNDTGLTNGNTYFYNVTAFGNVTAESGFSNTVSATPSTIPGPPLNLIANGGLNNNVSLTWTAPTSDGGDTITHYNVVRNGTSIANVTTLNYNDTGLTNNINYNYTVAANNTNGFGPFSNYADAFPHIDPIVIIENSTSLPDTPAEKKLIRFSITDDDFGNNQYYILRNGTIVQQGIPINNTYVEYYISASGTLPNGIWNFTITFLDPHTGFAFDTVFINHQDSIPIMILLPSDMSYSSGSLNNYIRWAAVDNFPTTFNVTNNGSLYIEGTWDSSNFIFVNIDGLSVGIHIFIIYVYDAANNQVSDQVQVTVT